MLTFPPLMVMCPLS